VQYPSRRAGDWHDDHHAHHRSQQRARLETARRLIDLGHTVLAGARDRQRGTKAARELGATFIHLDPTDDGSVEAAAARVRNEYGHLDVLIDNAGTAAPRLGAEELTAEAAMEGFAITEAASRIRSRAASGRHACTNDQLGQVASAPDEEAQLVSLCVIASNCRGFRCGER
jgi:NAD(P)-dependent dehydrogenase (short-subunit alcohol dehydrogenase family)